VQFNPVTVVSAVNVGHPDEVYRFLTEDLGCTRLQWLPCVEPKDYCTVAPGRWDTARMPVVGTPAARRKGTGPCFRPCADTPNAPESREMDQSPSVVTEWSVDPDDWGEFLCRTFDLWLTSGFGKVAVNWFESSVGAWMNEPAQMCNLAPVCGRSLVAMEKDGSLYSCDRFVYPEYRLGNLRDEAGRKGTVPFLSATNACASVPATKIGTVPLADVVYSDRQRQFGLNKRNSLTEHCRRCPYLFACHGECPKNRFVKSPDGQPGHNYLCPGLNRFFTHADPYLRQIAGQVLRHRAAQLSEMSVQTVVHY
jgi:uncharacterized protein